MAIKNYDSIVIGSGPAGEGASMKLAKCGQHVAIIEHYKDVGGGCTHWGTIPSKSLRHSVQMVSRFRNCTPLLYPLIFQYPDLEGCGVPTDFQRCLFSRYLYHTLTYKL
ncbi:MAG: FAD-dependent oxidoreductase, partial [Pseudomonadota bacterium]